MADSDPRRPGVVTDSVAEVGRRTLLVVESDPGLARQLEQTLTRGGYRVEIVHEGAGALGVLGNTLVDLVLSSLQLPDMDGFQLFRRVRCENRFRDLPFLFLSSDAALSTKVISLDMGVDDYLTKPIEAAELKARVDAALRRIDQARAAFRHRSYNLAGDFTGMSFPDLVTLLDQGRRTGRLSVVTPRAAAEVRMRDGRVIYAHFGSLLGEEAFYAILGEAEGQFEFAPGAVDEVEGAPPMSASCTALLMEGLRRADTDRQGGAAPKAVTRPAAAPAAPGAPAELVPAPAPDALLALELVDGVSDPFMLGEMKLFQPGKLREFTERNLSSERLHGLLVADLDQGCSALSALSGPLTDRQIADTLREPAHGVGLLFTLRKERFLDLVLVDAATPAALLDALRRQPSFVLVAPRQGDYLSFGVKSQVDLVALVQRLRPQVLVAVGNASLAQGLAELQARARTDIPTRLVRSSLDQAGADLRDLILEGISMWAEQAPAS